MKVINENKRFLFTLKEKTSGPLVVAPEELILVEESFQETPTPVDSRPYKVYTALLTQSGKNAPVAIVLENTLGGDIIYGWESEGMFTGTLSGVFTNSKTTFSLSNSSVNSNAIMKSYYNTSNDFYIETSIASTEIGTDALLLNTMIEIRVYN